MSKINRKKFFEGYREKIGGLRQEQVEGLEFLLSKLESDDYPLIDCESKMASVLGNIKLETNETYHPVIEGYYMRKLDIARKQSLLNYYRKHYPSAVGTIFPNGIDTNKTYEGRGYIQITHKYNYAKFGKHIGNINLVENPELALEKENAWIILYEGMTRSDLTFKDDNFTGYTLEQFFNPKTGYIDFYGARKIINGSGKGTVGRWSEMFYQIIELEDEET
jgi:hypothetical protein